MEEQLKSYSDDVRRDEPMRKHTTFRVGGPADFFVSVKDREALVGVTTFLKENGIPCLGTAAICWCPTRATAA